jgi:hypothetical protein
VYLAARFVSRIQSLQLFIMSSPIIQKEPVLLPKDLHVDIEAQNANEVRRISTYEAVECILEYTYVLLVLVIIAIVSSPCAISPSHCAQLSALAKALHVSTRATIPSSATILVLAPYLTCAEQTVLARYVILLCGLVGATLDALLSLQMGGV